MAISSLLSQVVRCSVLQNSDREARNYQQCRGRDPEHPKVNNDKRPKIPRWTRVELHDEFCSTAHLSQDSGEQRHRTSPCTLSLPRRSRSSIGVGWERRQRQLEEYLGDDFRMEAGRCLEGSRRSKGQYGLKSFSSTPLFHNVRFSIITHIYIDVNESKHIHTSRFINI
uniref:Uncharacterized protein n=1 Tax=Oryza meridionalis TaxID=40149 RepID=A0A0E0BXF3_9ORYZ